MLPEIHSPGFKPRAINRIDQRVTESEPDSRPKSDMYLLEDIWIGLEVSRNPVTLLPQGQIGIANPLMLGQQCQNVNRNIEIHKE